ncbi:ubiquinone biosynthesis methyltransferase UbiE [Sulfitobacter geojensis]|uniref:Ubiquinone biosynthesis methyltransferase UbiE n=1 Tax=Sulfitobacter geojensis TaxID=1342299 RepID=A0AAE2W0Y6_9RHOB|nr:ubiquinone biosynthesis methyltransferase UbiE [Sulfitobacter geojensis]MBM1695065.1 ubiquinone biosynthesis methyltransferase UbiE [Sulfitobacter geojensis]MBM1707138.1 ubiquinone biosynthesis methyltransferase UbiE [Sulfitobacter geojensis]MBM1711288.1 ubiquinone biosynthesis methyltransferase UbiE [Sulfitobacter geojensis]MBM1715263.1 ubiquinone biosynthesis methyltransferase UbiE [Sulfitobacter geojensis]
MWRKFSLSRDKAVLALKWAASIIQIMGYTATAFAMTPLNIYLFLVGLVGWFTVGLMWNDKAIMLIHVVALGAMVAGLISA